MYFYTDYRVVNAGFNVIAAIAKIASEKCERSHDVGILNQEAKVNIMFKLLSPA